MQVLKTLENGPRAKKKNVSMLGIRIATDFFYFNHFDSIIKHLYANGSGIFQDVNYMLWSF